MNTFGFQEYALAIVRNDVAAVKSALAAGAEVDPRDADQGSTPLIFAALFGRAEIANLLIAAGADVHATDYNGVDALTLAELDWQSTETIAKAFGIPLLDPGRHEARQSRDHQATPRQDVAWCAYVPVRIPQVQAWTAAVGSATALADVLVRIQIKVEQPCAM